jgi:hypothetical protein
MKTRGCLAIGFLIAPLVLGCGADNGGTQTRQPNAAQPYRTNYPPGSGAFRETQPGPSPQDMPGGGRGADPTHFKGKP